MSVYRICRKRLCAAVAGCLAPAWVLAGGLEFFEGSFDEALALAGKESKHVFVDVYTTWCGPCKIMDATVFADEEVGAYYNERFVNVKLDAEDEFVNGPAISERYDVGGYPTYLYLEPDGALAGRASGVMPPREFVEIAGQLLGGVESGFPELEARYEGGERDPAFVQQYLQAGQARVAIFEGDDTGHAKLWEALSAAADEYFSSRGYPALVNPQDFALIAYYRDKGPRGDALIEFVIENYDAFLAVAPEITLALLVLESNYYATLGAAESGDDRYRAYLDELSGPLKPAANFIAGTEPDSNLLYDSLASLARGEYLAAAGLWDELHVYAKQEAADPERERAPALRGAAELLQRSPEQAHQALALDYARQAYELEPGDLWGAISYSSMLAEQGSPSAAEQAEQVLQAALHSLEGKEGVTHIREMIGGHLEYIRQ